jgi:hypothetical protein
MKRVSLNVMLSRLAIVVTGVRFLGYLNAAPAKEGGLRGASTIPGKFRTREVDPTQEN